MWKDRRPGFGHQIPIELLAKASNIGGVFDAGWNVQVGDGIEGIMFS